MCVKQEKQKEKIERFFPLNTGRLQIKILQ
jgi:hypothetical protein